MATQGTGQFDLDLGGSTRAKRRLLDAWHGFAKAPQWRAARWAAGIAVVAQLADSTAWAFRENRAIELRQQQAKQVLQSTFPRCPSSMLRYRCNANWTAAQQLRRPVRQRPRGPAGR
jgi:type II secretory pathway component PulL